MSETQEEKCRVIAEWLEPKPTSPKQRGQSVRSSGGAWIAYTGGWQAADFYRDESASALILEKMPLAKLVNDPKHGGWMCESDWRFFHNGALHADRKSAIAEAALRLIELRKGEG